MRQMPILPPTQNQYDRVAFFGPMASGKTYCAQYLQDRGYIKVSFAAKLKEIAADLFDVHTKEGDDRRVLQSLGENMRDIDPDIWIKYALSTFSPTDKVVIDDLRYVNEAHFLKDNHFTLVLVSTPIDIRNRRIEHLYPGYDRSLHEHASEKEWVNIPYDAVVIGDGANTLSMIDDLLGRADVLLQRA